MTRDALAQAEPNAVDAYFPGTRPGRDRWFRAHRLRPDQSDGGCWYYASLPARQGVGGRFELITPDGTCFWAGTELAAAREFRRARFSGVLYQPRFSSERTDALAAFGAA